jgi:hypothetical protein
MSKTAAELIAHLESGGLIAKGEPNLPVFLRFEIYGENRVKYLGCYGWGSALGKAGDRLVDVLENPHKWVCLPSGKSIAEVEPVAKSLLEKLGRYEDYEWQLTVGDERESNAPKKA